jgi:hypothetical protein
MVAEGNKLKMAMATSEITQIKNINSNVTPLSVLSQSVFKAQLYHNESDESDDYFDEDVTSSNQNPFKGSITPKMVPVEEDNEESK